MELTIYLHPDFHIYMENIPDNVHIKNISDINNILNDKCNIQF